MFGTREQIPTARLTAPALERAAAKAKRGIRTARTVTACLVRAALITVGFGSAAWFSSASSPSTNRARELERIQLRNMQWRYDVHRTQMWNLMGQVEDISHRDGSATR